MSMSDKPLWLLEAERLWERGLLFGRARGETFRRENPTEPYVTVPPACIITDRDGATWTLGWEYLQIGSRFEWNVIRNDVDTGEFAERIEFRRGQVILHGHDGRRVASRSRRHML